MDRQRLLVWMHRAPTVLAQRSWFGSTASMAARFRWGSACTTRVRQQSSGLHLVPGRALPSSFSRQEDIGVKIKPSQLLLRMYSSQSSPKAPQPTGQPTEQPTEQPSKVGIQKQLLKENIATIPNFLTLGRLVMSPVVGYLIVKQQYDWALGTLVVVSLTDMLDGWIARTFNQKTFLGSALDPMADKVLMTILTVALTQAGLVPLYLASLIIGRDVFLILGTAYYRYKSLPPPKTVKRYFDLSLPSAEVRPPFISKLNTALQLVLMGLSVASPVFGFEGHFGMEVLQWAVAVTTVWSGLTYVLSKNVIKILPPSQK